MKKQRTPKDKSESPLKTVPETRREKIIKTAERIFAKKGFHEATVSEIASKAGVSDATIYEYFSTKEQLLFDVSMHRSLYGKEFFDFIGAYLHGAANKLRIIILSWLKFYDDFPDFGAVFLLNLRHNRNYMKTEAYQMGREWAHMIIETIQEGIESGEFKADTDPYLIRALILGAIEYLALNRILRGRSKVLISYVDPLTDTIIKGIQKENGPKVLNLQINLDPKQLEQK